MHWQDFILTAASLVFSAALIPSVLGKDKPAFSTSLMTGTVLGVCSVVYATLSLWFTTFTTALVGILWLTLAVQKYLQNKNLR